MKKYILLLLLLLTGCTTKTTLTCTYIDNTSIYGTKKIIDKIEFKNNKIKEYEKKINFTHSTKIKENKKMHKILKIEAQTLKKYLNGKYKIKKNNQTINIIFSTKKIEKLEYIDINIDDDINTIKNIYLEKGYECK